MGSSPRRNILSAALAATILAACGGGGVPTTVSSSETPHNRFGEAAGGVVLSGEYGGKVRDSIHGTSKVRLILSQSQDSVGGVLLNGGSGGFGAAFAWVANGNKISGNAVGPAPSGGYCTFSMSGTYKHRRLDGTYSATVGCSGESGTFTFRHKCYFEGTGSEAIRPDGGAKPC